MIAPTKGWLRVGSKGGAFGEKKISSTIARSANRIKEQLKKGWGVSFDSEPGEQLPHLMIWG